MRPPSLFIACTLSLCAALSLGCRRNHADSPAERVAMLQSPDPDERRGAADDLMDDGGPSPEAVPYLIAAIQREQDAKTYGVMLLALGKSGAPEARPYLEANLHNQDTGVRERAEKALELWARKNPHGAPMPQPLDVPQPPDAPAEPPPPLPAAPPGAPPPAPPPPQDPGETI